MGTQYDINISSGDESTRALTQWLTRTLPSAAQFHLLPGENECYRAIVGDFDVDLSAVRSGRPQAEHAHRLCLRLRLRHDDTRSLDAAVAMTAVVAQRFHAQLVYNKEFVIANVAVGSKLVDYATPPFLANALRERGLLDFALALEANDVKVRE